MGDANKGTQATEIELSDSSEAPAIRAVPSGEEPSPNKIRTFQQKLTTGRHEDQWNRTPNVTGTGAIHVKSFHGKFSEEALAHLDHQINEWLDHYPQYEVKLVTTSHGEWKGKFGVEPCLIVQVWV